MTPLAKDGHELGADAAAAADHHDLHCALSSGDRSHRLRSSGRTMHAASREVLAAGLNLSWVYPGGMSKKPAFRRAGGADPVPGDVGRASRDLRRGAGDRKSTRLNSRHMSI